MAAVTLAGDRREPMSLEQFHRAATGAEQEVVLADADPEQLQSLFQLCVVEFALLLLEPGLASRRDLRRGIRRRRAARARRLTREDVKQPGTEDADVAELLQVRQRDVERLVAAHRKTRNRAVLAPCEH